MIESEKSTDLRPGRTGKKGKGKRQKENGMGDRDMNTPTLALNQPTEQQTHQEAEEQRELTQGTRRTGDHMGVALLEINVRGANGLERTGQWASGRVAASR